MLEKEPVLLFDVERKCPLIVLSLEALLRAMMDNCRTIVVDRPLGFVIDEAEFSEFKGWCDGWGSARFKGAVGDSPACLVSQAQTAIKGLVCAARNSGRYLETRGSVWAAPDDKARASLQGLFGILAPGEGDRFSDWGTQVQQAIARPEPLGYVELLSRFFDIRTI